MTTSPTQVQVILQKVVMTEPQTKVCGCYFHSEETSCRVNGYEYTMLLVVCRQAVKSTKSDACSHSRAQILKLS